MTLTIEIVNPDNYKGNFQTISNQNQSKFTKYLDLIYSYPPKIKIKWNNLDESAGKFLEKEKSNITIKGDLIKSTYITSTMGVSYKIKLGKNI